jgi:hypothetical protein
VVFDEDSFSLAASPSLTDLDFFCESGPTVSTIGTHLTTAGTSTSTPRRSAPEIPLGFEPPVAPLPALAVPPGFLPQSATTAAYCTWPASPVTYVWREVGASIMEIRGARRAALRREVEDSAAGTHGAPGAAMRW